MKLYGTGGFSGNRQSPEMAATNQDRPRAERDSLKDIGTTANAAIDQHRNLANDGFDRFWQCLERAKSLPHRGSGPGSIDLP